MSVNFFLEKLELQVRLSLEKRIEDHLKNEFYNKILPKITKEIKQQTIIELIESDNSFDIKITRKEK